MRYIQSAEEEPGKYHLFLAFLGKAQACNKNSKSARWLVCTIECTVMSYFWQIIMFYLLTYRCDKAVSYRVIFKMYCMIFLSGWGAVSDALNYITSIISIKNDTRILALLPGIKVVSVHSAKVQIISSSHFWNPVDCISCRGVISPPQTKRGALDIKHKTSSGGESPVLEIWEAWGILWL